MSERNGILTKRRKRVLLWCCVLIVAGFIFCFSAEDGETSTKTSDQVVRVVVKVTHPEYESLSPMKKLSIWKTISRFVRKSAHFLEYTALGFFLKLLMDSYALRPKLLWAWLAGTAYAGTDELHQLFTSSRSGMWQDVLLDSSGVFTGGLIALALTLIVALIRRRGLLSRT